MIPSTFDINEQNGYLVANVIGFRQKDVNKPNRHKVHTMGQVLFDTNKTNIEVLAIWYFCQEDKTFKHCSGKLIVAIEQYIATIKPPTTTQFDSGIVKNILNFEYSELDNFIRDSK